MEKKDYVLNYFNNRSTNASAESFNSKIKGFRAQVRGVADMSFFLYRMVKIFGQERLSIHRQSLLSQDFNVILEDFSQCLIQRTLRELHIFEVMTWQPCYLLHSALNCFSSNSLHANISNLFLMRNIFYFTPAISVEFCTFAKNINMKLFEYTWFTDFHGAIEDLKSIAMKED